MKKYILFILLLSSLESKCDLPSLILCLGEFETNEGSKKSYYFNISSTYLYEDGNYDVNNKTLNLDRHYLQDTEVFTKFYDFNCGHNHIYGIDKMDLIDNSKIKLNNIRVQYLVHKNMFGYIGFLNNEILNLLKLGVCNCSNFNIDFNYQDIGGDSIETYYMFSNKNKTYHKKIINQIKKSYSDYINVYEKDNYDENERLYRKFVSEEIINIKNNQISILQHYY